MIKINKQSCCGCSSCMNICPQNAIKMIANNEGFLYPVVDKTECVECGLCEKVCPFEYEKIDSDAISSFAAVSKDNHQRMASSSGGIFSVLAKYIIKNNGFVYGAALSSDCFELNIERVDNEDEICKLMGSKYIQANMGYVYRDVKKQLDVGALVLYTGTPCQINGLKLYLNRDYTNLYCVDIICHGVPSQLLWKKYLQSISKRFHMPIRSVSFRCKVSNWHDYEIKFYTKSSDVYISKDVDFYLQTFFDNNCLRESCYECKAKKNRFSDITLGDFWGIEKVLPEFTDGYGTSAIIVRTEHGMDLFNLISNDIKYHAVQYGDIVKWNSAECKSVCRPIQRDTFYEDLVRMNLSKVNRKYRVVTFKKKLRNFKKNLMNEGIISQNDYGMSFICENMTKFYGENVEDESEN